MSGADKVDTQEAFFIEEDSQEDEGSSAKGPVVGRTICWLKAKKFSTVKGAARKNFATSKSSPERPQSA